MKIFIATVGTVALFGCYQSPDANVLYEDLDMIVTNYDKSNNYGTNYQTFSITDSFALASNTDEIDVDKINDAKFRNNIKNAIYQNMISFGYTEWNGDTTVPPDIYIPVTITYIQTQGISYYPIYWGGAGYSWGYPSYGYGGSYYYYYPSYATSYYEYEQGSLLIDWIDIKNRYQLPPDNKDWYADNVWNMVVSGVMRNSTDSDRDARIAAAINQGFEQSSYLKK